MNINFLTIRIAKRAFLLLAVSLFTVQLFSQYTITGNDVTIIDNEISTYHYSGNGDAPTKIIIPATINNIAIKSIGYRAFFLKGIDSVSIAEGIEQIGDYAFGNNTISEFSIPSSVKTIGAGAFSYNNIKQLNIPATVDSVESYAFWSNEITDINIQGNLKLGSSVFNNNNINTFNGKVTNGIIYAVNTDGTIDTTTITGYGGSATVIDFIPEGVEVFKAGSFESCGLTQVKTPLSTKYIGFQAFHGNRIEKLSIPGNLDSIAASAFSNNIISDITLPDSIISIGVSAFKNNEIASLKLPEYTGIIGESAFKNNNISHLELPDTTIIGNSAFRNNSLKSITIPGGIKVVEKLSFADNNITEIYFGEGVEKIRENSFYNNTLLDTVNLAKSIQEIEAYAFNTTLVDTLILKQPVIDNDTSSGWDIYNTSTGVQIFAGHDSTGTILIYYSPAYSLTATSPKQKSAVSADDVVADNVIVYPNPATEYIAIDGIEEQVTSINIFNINGTLLKSEEPDYSDNIYIDINGLPKGYYIVRIATANNMYFKKILKD